MKNKKLLMGVIFIIILIISFALFTKLNKSNTELGTVSNYPTDVYKNIEYGFTLNLPKIWEGYLESKTPIKSSNGENILGYTVIIRHPKWKENAQRMDIPIQVFTLDQWKKWEANNFEGYPTAAPIGPTERGRNSQYVFATGPRYNYSFAIGWEEVDEIIKTLKGITKVLF